MYNQYNSTCHRLITSQHCLLSTTSFETRIQHAPSSPQSSIAASPIFPCHAPIRKHVPGTRTFPPETDCIPVNPCPRSTYSQVVDTTPKYMYNLYLFNTLISFHLRGTRYNNRFTLYSYGNFRIVSFPAVASLLVSRSGDPHMTGFLVRKFDYTGEDGKWHSLISDLPGLHLNMVRCTRNMTYTQGSILEQSTPRTTEFRSCFNFNFS